jgi:hypothetical protein
MDSGVALTGFGCFAASIGMAAYAVLFGGAVEACCAGSAGAIRKRAERISVNLVTGTSSCETRVAYMRIVAKGGNASVIEITE